MKWRSTGTEVSVVLSMLNAVSHSTDHAILRVPGPDAFNKSVRGAAISEKDGIKVRKKFAIPKNERRCFTVSGAGIPQPLTPWTQWVTNPLPRY